MRLQIGLLPVLDQQYFSAGILPFALLLSVYFLYQKYLDQVEKIKSSLSKIYKTLQSKLRLAFLAVLLISAAAILLYPNETIGAHRANQIFWYFEFAILFFAAILGVLLPVQVKNSRRARLHTLMLPAFVLGIGVYFSSAVLSYIPQSLGGLSPCCATLDVDTSMLSDTTLVDFGLTSTSSGTARAPYVIEILFSNSLYTIVRLPSSQGSPVDISTKAIRSFHWQTC